MPKTHRLRFIYEVWFNLISKLISVGLYRRKTCLHVPKMGIDGVYKEGNYPKITFNFPPDGGGMTSSLIIRLNHVISPPPVWKISDRIYFRCHICHGTSQWHLKLYQYILDWDYVQCGHFIKFVIPRKYDIIL